MLLLMWLYKKPIRYEIISHLIGLFLKLHHIKIPGATCINHKCLHDINVWHNFSLLPHAVCRIHYYKLVLLLLVLILFQRFSQVFVPMATIYTCWKSIRVPSFKISTTPTARKGLRWQIQTMLSNNYFKKTNRPICNITAMYSVGYLKNGALYGQWHGLPKSKSIQSHYVLNFAN